MIFYGMCFFSGDFHCAENKFHAATFHRKVFREPGFRISVNYSFTPKVESGCKSDDNVEILIHLKILLDKGFIANTRDVTKNLTNFLSEENSVFLYD